MSLENERVQVAANKLRERADGALSHLWWALMIKGVLALGLGLSALIWPKLTIALLVQLIGVYALLDGITGLISNLRNRDLSQYLLPSLVSLAVGAVLLFWPGMTVKWLLIMLGILVLFHGVNLLIAGRSTQQDDSDRALMMKMGAVLAVIGLVLIVWPGAGTVTISWVVSALAFVVGAILVFIALRLRRIKRRVDDL